MATHTEFNDEQLTHRMFDHERELVTARFALSSGTLENTAHVSVLRKEIARIRTEARRREIEQGLPKGSLIRTHRSTWSAGSASGEVEGGDSEEGGGFLKGIVDKLTGND